MDWLKKRVWQLGIAIALAFVGAAMIYIGASDDASIADNALALIGLALFFVALAIPLASTLFQAVEEHLDLDV